MAADSYLQFNGYEVNNIQFELIDHIEENKEFEIIPEFNTSTHDKGNDHFEVALSVNIHSSESHPLPFNLAVSMVGKFSICLGNIDDELKTSLLRENTLAIMFPFLRSIVASITLSANIPPLILPVINIVSAFNNNDISE
jgi:preprotein translocase subunit SecB